MTAPDCDHHDPHTKRRHLRRTLLDQRLALSDQEYRVRSGAIRARLETAYPDLAQGIVAFCWPVKNEPDLVPLIETLLQRGARAALPVVRQAGQPLVFREWRAGSPLVADQYGIPTPVTGDELTPTTLLLPVNAFDAAGFRIGYGGGFFDRTLAGLSPRPRVIGVGFAFQQVDTTWPQAHDQPMDAIVTDAALIEPQQRNGGALPPASAMDTQN